MYDFSHGYVHINVSASDAELLPKVFELLVTPDTRGLIISTDRLALAARPADAKQPAPCAHSDDRVQDLHPPPPSPSSGGLWRRSKALRQQHLDDDFRRAWHNNRSSPCAGGPHRRGLRLVRRVQHPDRGGCCSQDGAALQGLDPRHRFPRVRGRHPLLQALRCVAIEHDHDDVPSKTGTQQQFNGTLPISNGRTSCGATDRPGP